MIFDLLCFKVFYKTYSHPESLLSSEKNTGHRVNAEVNLLSCSRHHPGPPRKGKQKKVRGFLFLSVHRGPRNYIPAGTWHENRHNYICQMLLPAASLAASQQNNLKMSHLWLFFPCVLLSSVKWLLRIEGFGLFTHLHTHTPHTSLLHMNTHMLSHQGWETGNIIKEIFCCCCHGNNKRGGVP